MRAPVALVLLFLASSLLAAELPISQPDIVPLDGVSWRAGFPAVAAGDGFLVTWAEYYSFTSPGPVKLRTYDADGLPRQAMPVTLGGGNNPRAFWNGSEYVVIWAPTISRFGSVEPLPAIVAVRVRPDGSLVEGSNVTLAESRGPAQVIDVAWDGSRAVTAVQYDGRYRLLLLDGLAAVLDDTIVDYTPSSVALRPGGGHLVLRTEQGDDAAGGGDRLAVIDARENGVTAVIFDNAENELERFPLSATGAFAGSIIWDGSAWVAAFAEQGALCTVRFTSSADAVRSCVTGVNAAVPVLAAGERRLFKAWASGAQVVTDGGLASTTFSAAYRADAVVDAAGLLAAWVELTADGRQIVIGGLANDGTRRPERHVPGRQVQEYPVLSRAGDQTLLVWVEGQDLLATLLDATGAPAGAGIQLRGIHGGAPAVAARGETWVIAWRGEDGIESIRLDRDLHATDLQDFSGSAFQETPSIAVTPAGFLVAWREWDPARLVVEPLDANGRRTTGGIRIVENGPIASPTVGCGPSSCLVAWDGESGEQWIKLVRHDGTPFTADRPLGARPAPGDAVIKSLDDGSFLVYRGGSVTPVSATGEPGHTQTWHLANLAMSDVVTWRGQTTAVYARSNGHASQIFAHEFVSRRRAVRR